MLWPLVVAQVLFFVRAVSTRSDDWRERRYVSEGDIHLAALYPLYTVDAQSGRCSVFNARLVLWQILALVDVLRQHDFALSARARRNGTLAAEKRLRLGYAIGDVCGGKRTATAFALALARSSRWGDFCPVDIPGLERPTNESRFNVMAMVGPTQDILAANTAAILANSGMVQLSPFVGGDQFSCALPKADGCERGQDYEYLFRIASTNSFQAYAIADILLHFNWTHFALVAAGDDSSSLNLMFEFLSFINKEHYRERLCMAFRETMDKTETSAVSVYRHLRRYSRAKAVVLLMPSNHIELLMDTILTQTEADGSTKPLARIWLGYNRWGRAIDFVFKPRYAHYGEIMQAVLVTTTGAHFQFRNRTRGMALRFSDYALGVTAGDLRNGTKSFSAPWWCRVIEVQRRCGGVCDPDGPLPEGVPRCADDTTVLNVYNKLNRLVDMVDHLTLLGTETAYQALQSLFEKYVQEKNPSLTGRNLAEDFYQYAYPRMKPAVKRTYLPCLGGLPNHTCQVFPENFQELDAIFNIWAVSRSLNRSHRVGTWELNLNYDWDVANHSFNGWDFHHITYGPDLFSEEEKSEGRTVPTSTCSPKCDDGQEEYTVPSEASCCHYCRNCEDRLYSNASTEGRCEHCPNGSLPNANRTQCVQFPIVEALSLPAQYTLASLCFLFFLVLVATTALHFKFWEATVVRASDRPLTILFLSTMMVSILLEIFQLSALEEELCKYSNIISSMSLLGTVLVLVVKTGRKARIYFSTIGFKSFRHTWSLSHSAHMLILSVVYGLVLICKVVEVAEKPPHQEEIHYEADGDTYDLCIEWFPGAVAMDCFTATLIVVAAVFAFFTRKLRENFADAHLLFLCALSLIIVWFTMRSAYYLAEQRRRPLLRSVFVVSHVFILWAWLLAPRVFILLFRPEKRNSVRLPRTSVQLSIRSSQVSSINSIRRTTLAAANAPAADVAADFAERFARLQHVTWSQSST